MSDEVTDEFRRLVEAIRPYLPDVVVVGGWAHRLFLRHPLARPIAFTPLTTDDADVAVPLRLPMREATLAEQLEGAGFTSEMHGDDQPPVTLYRLGAEAFYVEFLAPTTGSGIRRSGARDSTAKVQGIVAQKLPHIDILLVDPWSVSLPGAASAVEVRIPNAAAYLAQKLLVLPDREKDKQDNDVVYIYDTLAIFAETLAELGKIWSTIKDKLTRKQVQDVIRAIPAIFGTVDDRIRRAANIVRQTGRGAPPSPQQIRDRCAAALGQIFG